MDIMFYNREGPTQSKNSDFLKESPLQVRKPVTSCWFISYLGVGAHQFDRQLHFGTQSTCCKALLLSCVGEPTPMKESQL
jgi:hypothetical protein